jgi:diguanylate cyclase (GGDEF)-like protein
MKPRAIHRLAALFAALLAYALATPAIAFDKGEPSFAPTCHFASDENVSFDEVISRSDLWLCDGKKWVANMPVAWLRFEASSWEGEERPRYFFSRIARFDAMEFAALDADGTLRVIDYQERDARPYAGGPVFEFALPEVKSETRAILVRIERPHSVPLLTEARLAHYPEDSDWSQLEVMLLAFVLGMLILPLLFDVSFYVVLRERFVALHALMVIAMMTYVAFASGLISVFVSLPLAVIAVTGPLAWAIGCGISALFLADFLEPFAQSKIMRRVTIAAGAWCVALPGFFALQLPATQSFGDQAYFYTFTPVILIITAALSEAILRGSRSARFIGLAWTPIIVASVDRLLRGLGLYVGPSSLDQMLYLATGFEVIIISLAVADRFLALRGERDAALTEAKTLERLSERDPLTGLMNRRALDERFADYHRDGFETFALVDLDRFKKVNDTAGHAVGDAVLRTVAETLSEDPSMRAFRLGGEEFFVLLQGPDGERRAEQMRQSIALRVARAVPELEMLVTASVGLLVVPQAALPKIDFNSIYRRADMLMYEAKENGRNRMVSERLQSFVSKPVAERREGDRRKRTKVA